MFNILKVSAVKICKQCPQTGSASGELRPQTPYRGFALDPIGDFRTPNPLHYTPSENSWRRRRNPHATVYNEFRSERGPPATETHTPLSITSFVQKVKR